MSNADDSQDLVQVGNYSDALSAEAVRSCLEMEGVKAYVFDGEVAMMLGWYGHATGGAKVMVAKKDGERAVAALANLQSPLGDQTVAPEDEITPEGVYCQLCHSRHVRERQAWSLPTGFWPRLWSRFTSKTRVMRCRECGFAVRS